MLGMGVGWCGLMQFSKSQPQKSLEKNKALSSALGVYFFPILLLFAAPGRGGSSRSPPQ